jgi:ABC-type multidrug transport system ATPase subunit
MCRHLQIVPGPALLLLDEPTSGLDSSSSYSLSVMGHLRGMALAGHTIVTAKTKKSTTVTSELAVG